eukprot:TRINITY_DN26666_c0_g2_i1.p1 TRINITY_DN26666_c0_g2~~TRINITY_DN26666_c0_g2_i1.p1  ORF type:complete len:375 (-),score=56.15 TRINITY_DN26666_c0_g2_i1:88-1212(-)
MLVMFPLNDMFLVVLANLLVIACRSQHVSTMTKRLNDGTDMPIFGLGTWKSPKGQVEAAVIHALCSAGYRHIDAAQIYNNQEEVGRGIKHSLENCGLQRKDLWITSKIWNVDFQHVEEATDRILLELGLDYVDQLLLHWPTPYKKPPPACPPDCPHEFGGTDDAQRPRGPDGSLVLADLSRYPLSRTWAALEKVKRLGKVRSIGVSNFSPEEIDGLMAERSTVVPAVNQVEAHVFWKQVALRKAMRDRGIALVAYSPLGNPAIYGDKLDGMASRLVAEVAAEAALTPAQVMLNFLISLGDVVVPKSVTASRIENNINFSLNLTDSHIDRLAKLAPQARLANPKNRPGGKPVFDDAATDQSLMPEVVLPSGRREL